MSKRLTIGAVKNTFNSVGYVLLEDRYINNKTKLSFQCPKGHVGKMLYKDFYQGKRCRLCGNERASVSRRTDFNEVKEYFVGRGWKILSTRYKNVDTVLTCQCPEKHVVNISFHNFKSGCGCAYCSNRKVTDENNIKFLFPDICVEWDCVRNYPLTPEEFTRGSYKAVWWLCKRCNHSWKAIIKNRTINSSGCPACTNQVVTGVNNLRTVNSKLVENEWDYIKNYPDKPENFTGATNKKVWWLCKRCGNSWRSSISSRKYGRSCPMCCKGNVSPISQRWLDSLYIPVEHREVWIHCVDKKFKVDGFDPKTNTVYEFLGDFWHGNPEKFGCNEMNVVNKITFGNLYNKWLERKTVLETSGYNLIYIWESEYKGGQNVGRS